MSHLERGFSVIWELYGTVPAESQVIFHPQRGWLLDFAWVSRLIALEIQGGTFSRGRHSRGKGQAEDAAKNNAAVMMGWRMLYATTDMLKNDPISICDMIKQLLDYPVLYPNAEQSMWMARIRTLTRNGMVTNANGITVTRKKLRHYLIKTGKGEFVVTGEAPKAVEFILGGSLENPIVPTYDQPRRRASRRRDTVSGIQPPEQESQPLLLNFGETP